MQNLDLALQIAKNKHLTVTKLGFLYRLFQCQWLVGNRIRALDHMRLSYFYHAGETVDFYGNSRSKIAIHGNRNAGFTLDLAGHFQFLACLALLALPSRLVFHSLAFYAVQ